MMREFKTIRGYVIGGIAGAVLMLGFQAGAAGLLTGSKVTGTKDVTYNGKTIGQAAIINNTSYLPVRALADASGMGIDLSGGMINLSTVQQPSESPETSDTTSDPGQSTAPQTGLTAEQIQAQITEIDKQLQSLNESLEGLHYLVDNNLVDGNLLEFDKQQIEQQEALKSQLQQQKADFEAKLKALQNQ